MDKKPLDALGQLVGKHDFLLFPAIGLEGILFTASIVSYVLGKYLLGTVPSMAAIAGGVVLLNARKKYAVELESDLAKIIYEQLKKTGLSNFKLQDALLDTDARYKTVRNACFQVYKQVFKQALADLVVTAQERRALFLLAEKLGIGEELAAKLEIDAKGELYAGVLDKSLEDGILTKSEQAELERLRSVLGLEDSSLHEATHESAAKAYKELFRRLAAGTLTAGTELGELRDLARATGMSPAEAAGISSDEAYHLYRMTVVQVCQDGLVTEAEQRLLSEIEELLCIPRSLVGPLRDRVSQVVAISRIRQGKLPTLSKSNLHLRSTELCHWNTSCSYRYETRTKTIVLDGKLIVTNRRIIFSAQERAIEFGLKRILNIRCNPESVHLALTSTRGQGIYFVPDAETLAAILEVLVRKHNFQVVERMDSMRSRRIPDEVKVAVWNRDGGKCVKCHATDYLEYDHIIPFSKGGSNSEKNIQLLCRRCNLNKGGELV